MPEGSAEVNRSVARKGFLASRARLAGISYTLIGGTQNRIINLFDRMRRGAQLLRGASYYRVLYTD